MKIIPDILSASRAVSALAMLFFPVFSPVFWALYCWGGISDMIDGPLARKLGTVSEAGSRIDSAADLVFVVCSAVLILPAVDLPMWVWLWVALIGSVKAVGIIIGSRRQRKLAVPHSVFNRLTGLLLFCMPFAAVRLYALIPAVIVCISATASLFEDFQSVCK